MMCLEVSSETLLKNKKERNNKIMVSSVKHIGYRFALKQLK